MHPEFLGTDPRRFRSELKLLGPDFTSLRAKRGQDGATYESFRPCTQVAGTNHTFFGAGPHLVASNLQRLRTHHAPARTNHKSFRSHRKLPRSDRKRLGLDLDVAATRPHRLGPHL